MCIWEHKEYINVLKILGGRNRGRTYKKNKLGVIVSTVNHKIYSGNKISVDSLIERMATWRTVEARI